jgi:putative aldouronate transport system permease protein
MPEIAAKPLKKYKALNRISMPANILLNIFFLFCVFMCLYPLLLVIGVSFTDNDALREGYRVIPKVFSLDGYKFAVASGAAIVRAYGVTIFVTVVGTILHLAICSLFAYPLSRPEFTYRNKFMIFIMIPMLFGGGLIPWYVVCTQILHLKNTIFALFLPNLFSPWNVIVLRTFMQSNIPESLVESARLDGSTELQTFYKIVMPLSKAGLATIAFMVALGFWNDYWLPLMLISDEKLNNLQYLLYRIMANITFLQSLSSRSGVGADTAMGALRLIPQETARMAMCVLSIGPIILTFPFFQRYFVKGLTIGAVKG